MTTELVAVDTLADRMEYSKALAVADLLPPAFKGKPANILLAMDLANSLGRSAIEVMQQSQVISGKLGLSAEFMRSLVLASGHRIRVYMDGHTAVAEGVRVEDPDFTYVVRWDLERAKRAGLSGGNYGKFPEAMLKARATTELCRDAFADVIHGVRTVEELRDMPADTPSKPDLNAILADEPIEGEIVTEPLFPASS